MPDAGPVAPTPTPIECIEGTDLVDPCLTPLPIATPTPTPIVFTTTTVTVRKYYFFGSQRVAIRETNESHNYLHWDHLGSTVLTTYSSSGTRQSERAYYAFGDDRRTVNTPLTDNLFTGQKKDESGLYYYNARYYDPEIGQFISPDTIVPDPMRVDSYNRYMYSLGNPLRFSDPSGHCPTVQPDLQDEEARAEHINCWDLAVKIYLMYDSDPFWQERFQIEREDWFVKIATMSGNDVAYMQNQMDAWYFDFTARVGLPHPDRHVEWHAPPPSAYNEAEILGLFRGEGLCDVWDCVAIGLDLASLGTQLARDTSLLSTPVTGPAGVTGVTYSQVAQMSIAVASNSWLLHQMSAGNTSRADLAISGVTTIASYTPVIGEFAAGGQLLWDIFDPFLP